MTAATMNPRRRGTAPTALRCSPSTSGPAAARLAAAAPPAAGLGTVIEALNELVETLGTFTELDDLLRVVAARICRLTGVPRCSIYLREPDTQVFPGRVGHSDRDIDDAIRRLVAGVPADRLTREIVDTRRPVVIEDALTDPRPVRSTIRRWNIHSVLGVPMIGQDEVIGIVFLDHEHERRAFSTETIGIATAFAGLAATAVIQARTTARLRTGLGTAARQNELLRRAAVVEERLTRILLNGGDLGELADEVAQLTARPVAVYDAHDVRLATSLPEGEDPRTLPGPLDACSRRHQDVEAAVGKADAAGGALIGPFASLGIHHRFLLVPILTHGRLWGRFVVCEHRARFGALDLHIARRVAAHMALELTVEQRTAGAQFDARASLASELVRGLCDERTTRRRAEYLGFDLDAPRVLALISCPDDETPAAAEITAAFDQTGGEPPLVTAVAEGAVALLSLDGELPTLGAVTAARDRVAAAIDRIPGARVAISARCGRPADYPRAFGEAKQVMSCLQTLAVGADARLLTADELGPGRLFLASADRLEADRFARDSVGALLGDDDNLRTLLFTLQVYFDSARSVRRSSVALAVHENTIRYRLSRIAALTGLAIGASAADELTAQLALLVLRLQGTPLSPEEHAAATDPGAPALTLLAD
jgi:GAF domain-containing protein